MATATWTWTGARISHGECRQVAGGGCPARRSRALRRPTHARRSRPFRIVERRHSARGAAVSATHIAAFSTTARHRGRLGANVLVVGRARRFVRRSTTSGTGREDLMSRRRGPVRSAGRPPPPAAATAGTDIRARSSCPRPGFRPRTSARGCRRATSVGVTWLPLPRHGAIGSIISVLHGFGARRTGEVNSAEPARVAEGASEVRRHPCSAAVRLRDLSQLAARCHGGSALLDACVRDDRQSLRRDCSGGSPSVRAACGFRAEAFFPVWAGGGDRRGHLPELLSPARGL
jgi:hypothetical protein